MRNVRHVHLLHIQTTIQLFTAHYRFLTTLGKTHFENIEEKGENAGNQHFLLFPQCFLLFPKQFSIFQSHLFCRLQMVSIWTSHQFCRLVTSIFWSKLKAFADERIKWNEKEKLVSARIKNIVGKGENAGYQHFLLFPQCFQSFVFHSC